MSAKALQCPGLGILRQKEETLELKIEKSKTQNEHKKYYKNKAQMNPIASSSSTSTERPSNELISQRRTKLMNSEFHHWIDQMTFGNTKAEQFPLEFSPIENKGFGMRSKKDIKNNEIIMRLPLKDMTVNLYTVINEVSVRKFMSSAQCSASSLKFEVEHLYIVFFISHKRKGYRSRLYPYFKLLPKNINVPNMWDNTTLNLLEIDERKRIFQEQDHVWDLYMILKEALNNACMLVDLEFEEEFLWAYNVIKTRAFTCDYVKINKIKTMIAKYTDTKKFNLSSILSDSHVNKSAVNWLLVPYVDIINHSSGSYNCEYYTTEDEFIIHSNQAIKKHEEITISYGDAASTNCLYNYGFVDTIEENPFEEIHFRPEEIDENPLKYVRLEECGLYDSHEKQVLIGFSVTHLGCSVALQKAAIMVSIESPKDINQGFLGYVTVTLRKRFLDQNVKKSMK